VNVISKPKLLEAVRMLRNSELVNKVGRWYELASKNDFANFVELKQVFPSADMVGERLVFNVGAYRLICGVSFLRRTLYFKELLSHAAYEQGGWKS
jgi:mRNA interferase HigB